MLSQRKCLGTVGYLGGLPSLIEDFAWSFIQLIQWNSEYICGPGEYIHYDRATKSEHAQARNYLVQHMRGDWLFQLDTDHVFEPDLLGRMLKVMDSYNLDVLTGLYLFREPPHSPVLFRWDAENARFPPIGSWDKDAELLEIGSAGAGCLLVKRAVFERIVAELKEWPFDVRPPHIEDHSFYLRLIELGVKAYCAPLIEC